MKTKAGTWRPQRLADVCEEITLAARIKLGVIDDPYAPATAE